MKFLTASFRICGNFEYLNIVFMETQALLGRLELAAKHISISMSKVSLHLITNLISQITVHYIDYIQNSKEN